LCAACILIPAFARKKSSHHESTCHFGLRCFAFVLFPASPARRRALSEGTDRIFRGRRRTRTADVDPDRGRKWNALAMRTPGSRPLPMTWPLLSCAPHKPEIPYPRDDRNGDGLRLRCLLREHGSAVFPRLISSWPARSKPGDPWPSVTHGMRNANGRERPGPSQAGKAKKAARLASIHKRLAKRLGGARRVDGGAVDKKSSKAQVPRLKLQAPPCNYADQYFTMRERSESPSRVNRGSAYGPRPGRLMLMIACALIAEAS